MPLYELARNETADPAARRKAAEVLVRVGALRRKRVGPSPAFLWLVAATWVIVSVAVGQSIGAAAIALFVAGIAGLIGIYRWASRRERESGIYIGPDGNTIHLGPDLTR